MNGRHSITMTTEQLADEFGVSDSLGVEFERSYNVSPPAEAPVVRMIDGKRSIELLSWGLVPRWARTFEIRERLMFARGENIEEPRAFRNAFRERRCLVPSTGYFEWQSVNGRSQPYFVRHRDRPMLVFAGLWEPWDRDGKRVETFVIFTTWPNQPLRAICNRMPVIVPPERYDAWLSAGLVEKPNAILRPAPDGELIAVPVGDFVNDVCNTGPECVAPIGFPSIGDL